MTEEYKISQNHSHNVEAIEIKLLTPFFEYEGWHCYVNWSGKTANIAIIPNNNYDNAIGVQIKSNVYSD
jgi:hypothetical protein